MAKERRVRGVAPDGEIRASWGHVVAVHFGLLLVAALATLVVGPRVLGHAKPGETADPVWSGIALAAVWAWVLYSAAAVVVNRLRLTAEQVERRTVLNQRVLRRADIVGVRRSGDNAILLCTDLKRQDGLEVPTTVARHPVWAAWLQTLPDLDHQDAVEEQAREEADPALGRNPAERRERLVLLRRISGVIFLAVVALSGWALFWPRPYELTIGVLAVTPFVALLILWRGYGWAGHIEGLVSAIFLPVLILCLRAMFDLEVLDAWPLGLCAGAVALIPAGVAAVWSKTERWWPALFLGALAGVFAFVWAWSLASFADVMFDASPSWKVRATVVARDDDEHRVELTLRTLGPPHETFKEISVSKREAKTLRAGDTVCLVVHRGRLGWRWGYLSDC